MVAPDYTISSKGGTAAQIGRGILANNLLGQMGMFAPP